MKDYTNKVGSFFVFINIFIGIFYICMLLFLFYCICGIFPLFVQCIYFVIICCLCFFD